MSPCCRVAWPLEQVPEHAPRQVWASTCACAQVSARHACTCTADAAGLQMTVGVLRALSWIVVLRSTTGDGVDIDLSWASELGELDELSASVATAIACPAAATRPAVHCAAKGKTSGWKA